MKSAALLISLLLVAASTAVKFNIVHTTDIHGWVAGHPHNETLNADLGDFHSLLLHMKANAAKAGEEFLLFDTGDLIEGTGLSDATEIHGEYIFDIIKNVSNYDALTIGNHDIGHPEVVTLMQQSFIPFWDGAYLTSNSEMAATQEDIGAPYTVIKTDLGSTILVLGYIFNFTHQANNTIVVPAAVSVTEAYFSKAMAIPNVDLVVVCTHIAPQAPTELTGIYKAVRAAKPSSPIILLSGHSHVEYFQQYDDNAFTLESGKYFEEFGLITFDLEDQKMQGLKTQWIDTTIDNFITLSGTTKETFDTVQGKQTSALIQYYAEILGLNVTYGCAPMTYYNTGEFDETTSLYGLLVKDIVPGVVFNTKSSNSQFFITNTATLRYNLFEGPVTRNDIYTISPFNDTFMYYPDMPGQELQELINGIRNTSGLDLAVKTDRCGGPIGDYGPDWYMTSLYVKSDLTYDVVLAEYDAQTIYPVVQKLFPHKKYSEYKPYDTEWNGTGALQAYVQQTWKCK